MSAAARPLADLPDDLEDAIQRLKRERNAVLLAHYYQEDAVQDLADHVGDSLALARIAEKIDCDVIAFCGVNFMAETAKILNPKAKVVVPDRRPAARSPTAVRPTPSRSSWRSTARNTPISSS